MSTGWTGVGSSLEISGRRGHESECGSRVDLNMSMNVLHERVNESLRTHYALDWGPGVAPGLSDDSALLLRVAHTTVVPRGYGGALTSGAEMNLVEPFESVAFGYTRPPMVAGLDSKEEFKYP
ncbi:hypothetical protein EDD16DRAFT_1520227 [Pisolithus croceorrhizus]|nr:hypothetical protein EDD16DRAFT_1520227 [Pisolithus croceorrhizus]